MFRMPPRRVFNNSAVTKATQKNSNHKQHHQKQHEQRKRFVQIIAAVAVSSITATSYYIRKWREEQISTLESASACNVFYVNGRMKKKKSTRASTNEKLPSSSSKRRRDIQNLATTVARAGLMGSSESVKKELEIIRKWHRDHGFQGGLVLRELTEPLFTVFSQEEEESSKHKNVDGNLLSDKLNEHECYYLYYEVLGNGEIKQQIFCRGTTLKSEVLTCLKAVLIYDEELGCNVHLGFRDHAERLLNDVEPLLLTKPSDKHSASRGTVELSGHSLGGAVATLVACKLKKRGYNVIRLTTIGSPRVCDRDAVPILQNLLPSDTLRIEDDRDAIPYLPPYGAALGDKLWFVEDKKRHGAVKATFVPFSVCVSDAMKWVDSVLINAEIPELVKYWPKPHLSRTYLHKINQLADEIEHQRSDDDSASMSQQDRIQDDT